jgi:hypothetical protein
MGKHVSFQEYQNAYSFQGIKLVKTIVGGGSRGYPKKTGFSIALIYFINPDE